MRAITAVLILILGAHAAGADTTLDLPFEHKAWAFEIRADGNPILVGGWTRELCEEALRGAQGVENPHIRALGSCFPIWVMSEQPGLAAWMVEPDEDRFIIFQSQGACKELTAEVHEGEPSRPSCSRVWVRTVV